MLLLVGIISGDSEVPVSWSKRRFSSHLHEFCYICLERESSDRPSAIQLLQHPVFKLIKKGVSLPELLKPALPLNDKVAFNGGEKCFSPIDEIINETMHLSSTIFYMKCLISRKESFQIVLSTTSNIHILNLPKSSVRRGYNKFQQVCPYSCAEKLDSAQRTISDHI